MDPIQHAMLGLKDKMILLEKFGRNGSWGAAICFTVSQRNLNQTSALTVIQEMISQKGNAGFQLYSVQVKMARFLLSLVYLSDVFFPHFAEKENHSLFFISVNSIISWTRILGILHIFNFLFSKPGHFFEHNLACHKTSLSETIVKARWNSYSLLKLKRTILWLNCAFVLHPCRMVYLLIWRRWCLSACFRRATWIRDTGRAAASSISQR